MEHRTSLGAALAAGVVVSTTALAQPTNTTLPGGWSWLPVPAQNGTYDTGLLGTPRGGQAGQTTPPFNDTSYGVMNESGTPWFTGTDLSAQQYIQRQAFGNFGTAGATGRFFNSGFTGPSGPTVPGPNPTASGANFPITAAERRSVTASNWNNPNPDAGGVATLGQIVYVPVLASLTVGQGFGGDEMLVKVVGGDSGQRSRFRVDANIDASWSTSAFGGLTNTNNRINVNAITEQNDAGSGNNYDVPWGFNVPLGPGGQNLGRDTSSWFVLDQGVNLGAPGAGLTANSVGVGLTDSYNVLAALAQDGSSFTITFDSAAELFISRQQGNADARAQIGPGMEGNVRLVVEWRAFQAIPTPGSAAILAAAGLALARRRR